MKWGPVRCCCKVIWTKINYTKEKQTPEAKQDEYGNRDEFR
jgi:hypothetical protein